MASAYTCIYNIFCIDSSSENGRIKVSMIKITAGDKYAMLTAVRLAGRTPRGYALWEFLCDCGNSTIKRVDNIVSGRTRSCGCLIRKHAAALGKLGRSLKDCSGQRFGLLVVQSRATNVGRKVCWTCLCDCGKTVTVAAGRLHRGDKTSCGCRGEREQHGETQSPEYQAWCCMKTRALNPNIVQAHCYSARGITICREWSESFSAFLKYVGRRPSPGHSIDRIRNNDGYVPGNVHWATREEQANNTRRNRWLEIGGKRQTMAQWSKQSGTRYKTINDRLRSGWSAERAVFTPVEPR